MTDKERGTCPSPSATTRVSIRWGDDVPDEKTSTLVLTSPSGLFVDLRIFADSMPDTDPESSKERPLSAIDWAFAGRSTRRPAKPDGTTVATWTHWVDSRTADALSVHDTGICRPIPNGDELESGEMRDPTGTVRTYEEIWHDEIVNPSCAAVFICGRNAFPLSSASAMDVDSIPHHEVCGMMIRVGGWCQGVVRDLAVGGGQDHDAITAERWSLGDDGTWQCVFRAGPQKLPISRVNNAPFSAFADDLSLSEGRLYWKCVELYDEQAGAKVSPS